MGSQNSTRTIKTKKVSKRQDLALFMVVKEGSPEAVRVLEKSENWKHLRISDVIFK
jgi:hypothetical protein